MKIDAGKLDRRIELQTSTTTRSRVGQPVRAFARVAVVYGQRLDLRTQDAARAGQRDAFAISRFLIRWRAGVSTSMRALVDGRLYDVVAVDEPDRRQTMILTLEEVADAVAPA